MMNVARTAVALLALAAFVLLAGCGGDPAFTAGKVYLQQKDYGNAVVQLKMAIKNSPGAWEPHMWLGRTYAETDKLDEASEHLHAALDLAPDEKATSECRNAIAYYTQMFRNEGNSKMEAAQYEMALAEYEKALVIDPHNANSLVNLGAAYQNLGDYDAAISAYEEAQALDPDSESILEYLLDAYSFKAGSLASPGVEDYDGAVDYYERIEGVAPDFPDLLFNLGNMHYLSEHWRKAIDYFEKHLDEDAEDTDALSRVYYSYWKLAEEIWDLDEVLATEYYEKVIEAVIKLIDVDDTISYHRMLVRIYNKLERPEEAQAELEQIRMLLETDG
ncbi:MAG: tetratricopeptide repeat protein [Candidatus Eisenbacteria sp.]|nr:tetratricopeptide repeat protein [Candidatus Eisenbacteria bacterium]